MCMVLPHKGLRDTNHPLLGDLCSHMGHGNKSFSLVDVKREIEFES